MPRPLLLKVAEAPPPDSAYAAPPRGGAGDVDLPLMKRAHADLGRLGVFWHTQGSGKSYSMAFFAEKVRRVVPGNFTFLVMTDREDLDDQIWRTFIGCGVTDEKTPRAGSGKVLQGILRGNHRFVFSLIHKFNQPVTEPYSERDDIIVTSDEAHRTQAGKFARNMRLGMLKSLREALAQYALGDEDEAGNGGDIVAPIEELVAALLQAIEATEKHLLGLGFDATRLHGATGFDRIQALRDAIDAVFTSDEAKRRFEILARQVFIRFKALLMELSALAYAERHDNIEAIYKKLQDRRDTADVTEVLKELHRTVNEAIRAAAPGEDHAEGLTVDLSQIDFAKLRDEFASKVRRKHAALQDIRDVLEKKLAQMLAHNPMRMDYYKKYQEIIADYNREKDRTTVKATFAQLVALAATLDADVWRARFRGLRANASKRSHAGQACRSQGRHGTLWKRPVPSSRAVICPPQQQPVSSG